MDRGAHFFRCDFQVHTPRDVNWKGGDAVSDSERKKYAEELVLACPQNVMHDLNVATLTLLGAITLFLFSQFLLKFVFEPMSRVRRTLADISSTVLFHQAKITNGHPDKKVATKIRKLSAKLRAAVFEVRFYRLFATISGVPSETNARAACHQLNLLSSGMDPAAQQATPNTNWADANTLALEKVGDLLGIQTKY